MINSITVCGNMAADPEERKGERTTFAKGRIGVSQPGKDREGNPKPTIWLDLTAWSQWQIKDLLRCSTGDRVTASGRLELQEWTGRDGAARQSLGIRLSDIERHDRSDRPARGEEQAQAPRQPAADDMSDLPF